MASGKSKKFGKGRTMDLNEFITTPVSTNLDWAEIMEDNNVAPMELKTEILSTRSQLPSAPRHVREAEELDLSQVPYDPPFQAFFNNIPFTAEEDDLYDIVRNCEVEDIFLIPDKTGFGTNNKHQGRAVVTFKTREGLIAALKVTNTRIDNREVRITVHQQQQRGSSFNYNNRGDDRYNNQQSDSFSSFSNRRRDNNFGSGGGGGFDTMSIDRRPQPQPQQGGYNDRQQTYNQPRDQAPQHQYQQGGRAGYQGGQGQQQQGYQQDSHGSSGGGQYNNYDRGGGQHQQFGNRDYGNQQHRGGYNDHNRNGGNAGYDRAPNSGYDRASEYDRPATVQQPPPPVRHQVESHQPVDQPLPTERPKIKIQPRSKPSTEEDLDAPAPNRNDSIFGGAKPVDTTKKDLEILAKEEEERKHLHDLQRGEHVPLRIDTTRRTSERTLSQSSTGPHSLKSPKSPVSSEAVRLAPQVPPTHPTGPNVEHQQRPQRNDATWGNRGGGGGGYNNDRGVGYHEHGRGGPHHRGAPAHRGGYAPREFHRGGNRGGGGRGGVHINDRGAHRGGAYRGQQPRVANVAPRHARGGARHQRQQGARELNDEEFEREFHEQQPSENNEEDQAEQREQAEPQPLEVDEKPVNFTASNRFANLSVEDVECP